VCCAPTSAHQFTEARINSSLARRGRLDRRSLGARFPFRRRTTGWTIGRYIYYRLRDLRRERTIAPPVQSSAIVPGSGVAVRCDTSETNPIMSAQ